MQVSALSWIASPQKNLSLQFSLLFHCVLYFYIVLCDHEARMYSASDFLDFCTIVVTKKKKKVSWLCWKQGSGHVCLKENWGKCTILGTAHNPLLLRSLLQYCLYRRIQYANNPSNQSKNAFIMCFEHLRCSWWVFCGCLMNHWIHMIWQTKYYSTRLMMAH